MILVLHGDNQKDSYEKLTDISSKVPKNQKVKLTKENTKEDLYEKIFTQAIFDDLKLIICENFLKDKKITAKDQIFAQNLDKSIVFWESSALTPASISKLSKSATVENFKQEPKIFWFLDSIVPNPKQVLSKLNALEEHDIAGLIWNLAQRTILLILAKDNATLEEVKTVTGKPVLDWQWQKIKNQAAYFNKENLKALLSGILKVDYLIKTGKTSLPPKTLLTFLFQKYLR